MICLRLKNLADREVFFRRFDARGGKGRHRREVSLPNHE
jgi:hypothetical protein